MASPHPSENPMLNSPPTGVVPRTGGSPMQPENEPAITVQTDPNIEFAETPGQDSDKQSNPTLRVPDNNIYTDIRRGANTIPAFRLDGIRWWIMK